MWGLLACLWAAAAGAGAGWWRGWRAGRAAGDLAHATCHRQAREDQKALLDTLVQAADIEAWEEEL